MTSVTHSEYHSMVSFLAAFMWNCFDDSNAATRTIMGVAWVAFAVLVLWCVWMGWAKHETNYAKEEEEAAAAQSSEPAQDPIIKVKGESDNEDGMTSTSKQNSHAGRRRGGIFRNLRLWTLPARLLVKGGAKKGLYDSHRTSVQQPLNV